MNKSCFGYVIDNDVYCYGCGERLLDSLGKSTLRRHVQEVRELHSESSDETCSECGTSLGESDQ